jgi:antitoxin component YwqK of YwqJK toxin-antitoxin module
MKSISLRTFLFALLVVGSTLTVFSQTSPESLNERRERRRNLTVREYNSDAKGKNRWMDHVTVYNAKGFKIEEIEYATYGMRERVVFEYDANDLCVKEIVYDDHNKVSRIRKYVHNADGTKKSQFNYLPNGRLYSTKVYQYSN